MTIAVQLEPATGTPPEVEYRWDPDTDILSAQLRSHSKGDGDGGYGSLEVEGSDGSWLIIDLAEGRINGVEVAVWPDVRKLPTLDPPPNVEDAQVTLPARRATAGVANVEVDVPLIAESDTAERVIHFRLGKPRDTRVVRVARVARDLLLEVDQHSRLAGVWLLNVPPFPEDA